MQTSATDPDDRRRRRARRYFVSLIWCSLALSVLGNGIHAVEAESAGSTAVRVAVGILPPLILAALIHGLGHLAGAGMSGRLYWFGVLSVVAVAALAGVASFVALRELAVGAGWSTALAPLLPIIVDAPVPIATAVVVAIDRAAMRVAPKADRVVHQDDDAPALAPEPVHHGLAVHEDDGVVHQAHGASEEVRHTAPVLAVAQPETRADQQIPAGAPEPVVHQTVPVVQPDAAEVMAPPVHQDVAPAPAMVHRAPVKCTSAPKPEPEPADGAPLDDDEVHRLADRMVSERRTTADFSTVREVLARSARGESSRAVAEATGIGSSTVLRIKKSAAELAEDRELLNA
ncbi:DUF2637 domain-containing protein [Gordonia sp. PP30]|uniref:DUF2637 domain-containing protein n=1 Tax=Gordonia sp. PP30 TaxID=2935861 RepID=UPI0020001E8F|nr:DUF2637 domain-containing protein [Gordonia sp. PP30]UQE75118.1 DUF2637 domain-containing protein [Gordonia sp. PP30]